MSARSLLVRGMLVGVAAAALAYLFATLFGEPPVNSAIAFEDAHAAPGMAGPEIVSRALQSTLGLAVAVLVYGAALGGIFGLAFAFAYGRLGPLTARSTSLLVALIGFVAVFAVPYLKYPANPPAVGNPDTIGQRTALYFLMVAIGVAAAVGAVITARALTPLWGAWNATLAAAGGFIAVVAIAGWLLPMVNEVPADFPATVLWRFRVASLGTQAVLWASLGLGFGALTDRAVRRRAAGPAVPVG
jgi:Probable cobalt transporter subunit (CbtA)